MFLYHYSTTYFGFPNMIREGGLGSFDPYDPPWIRPCSGTHFKIYVHKKVFSSPIMQENFPKILPIMMA